MQISICCPSYRRPKVKTFEYLPMCRCYVAEKEYPDYIKANPGFEKNIISAPDDRQGNLCRIRNWILKKEFEAGADVVLLLDDDLNTLGYFEGNERHKLPTREVMPMIEKYSLVAQELGAKFWGVNLAFDKQNYREYAPFSLGSYIGGPFQCFLKGNELEYDERLYLKEDYDMTLQQLNRYRKVLRVNKFYYLGKQSEQAGGCAVQRNFEVEEAQLKLLQKKWGEDIVKIDTSDRSHASTKARKRIDYNPVIHPPL